MPRRSLVPKPGAPTPAPRPAPHTGTTTRCSFFLVKFLIQIWFKFDSLSIIMGLVGAQVWAHPKSRGRREVRENIAFDKILPPTPTTSCLNTKAHQRPSLFSITISRSLLDLVFWVFYEKVAGFLNLNLFWYSCLFNFIFSVILILILILSI